MRYTIIFSMLLLFVMLGCNKNKYTTVPQIKFKSVNTTNLHRGEVIVFTLSFTDAEGDLTDTVFIQKVASNCVNSKFSAKYKVPDFPTTKDQSGQLSVTYGYNVTGYSPIQPPQCPPKNDTCVFKFVLKDKAQNKSDTATSPTIIIYN